MIGGRENGRDNRTGLSGAPAAAWRLSAEARRFSDLISYQNDGKSCAMIADRAGSVSEYAAECMAILTDR